MWREIVVIITGCLNVLCPLKMITVRQDQLDWFDGELRSAIDTKFSLFKKACSSGQENEWKFYTSIKKHVRKLTIKKKRVYIRPNQKNSCVQVSLPTLILGPTLKMLKFF